MEWFTLLHHPCLSFRLLRMLGNDGLIIIADLRSCCTSNTLSTLPFFLLFLCSNSSLFWPHTYPSWFLLLIESVPGISQFLYGMFIFWIQIMSSFPKAVINWLIIFHMFLIWIAIDQYVVQICFYKIVQSFPYSSFNMPLDISRGVSHTELHNCRLNQNICCLKGKLIFISILNL